MKIRINGLFSLFLIIYFNIYTCKPLKNTFKSVGTEDEIATITTDSEKELLEAIEILNENGGTIYIDTPVINMVDHSYLLIRGNFTGGIMGVRQHNGEYPRINFVHSNKVKPSLNGVIILASNIIIRFMIIENSLSSGFVVIGDNNIFDNVISRYNNGPGILVLGSFNNFNYCYSYRNCEASPLSVTGDGFKIYGDGDNVFYYCFAWDNSNSGFNYAGFSNSSELSYIHSGSWNNGNINVFTGKYDYDNGNPLDKNLWTIKDMIQSDENFVGNYYNKKYNIDEAKISMYTAKEWISLISPKMDGNGFTFGNLNSSQSIDVIRNSFNNVAFGHKSGGFIDINYHRYRAYFTDCVSFNNGINYRLTYTLSKWLNNWSWNSNIKDQLKGIFILKNPRNTNAAQRQFYSIRNQIQQAVYANMFPESVDFDKVIGELIE